MERAWVSVASKPRGDARGPGAQTSPRLGCDLRAPAHLFGAILAASGLLRDGLVTALVRTAVLFGAAGVTLWRMSTAAGPYYQAHDDTRTTGDAAVGP